LYERVGDAFRGTIVHTYAGTCLLLLLMVAYDFATRRRIHPALLSATAILLACQLLVSWAYHGHWWPPVARRIVGL
jgi:hypothetical protein